MRIFAACLGMALLVLPAVAQTAQPTTTPAEQTATPAKQTSDKVHKIHFYRGSVWASASYAPYYNPWGLYGFYLYPGDYYPWVGNPWFGNPFWPGYAGASSLFVSGADKGEVRLAADPRFAQVFIDGAYAGTADRLKSMWLDPGAYDLSVSIANHETFHQRIYVLTGKSLKITAKLSQRTAANPEVKP